MNQSLIQTHPPDRAHFRLIYRCPAAPAHAHNGPTQNPHNHHSIVIIPIPQLIQHVINLILQLQHLGHLVVRDVFSLQLTSESEQCGENEYNQTSLGLVVVDFCGLCSRNETLIKSVCAYSGQRERGVALCTLVSQIEVFLFLIWWLIWSPIVWTFQFLTTTMNIVVNAQGWHDDKVTIPMNQSSFER